MSTLKYSQGEKIPIKGIELELQGSDMIDSLSVEGVGEGGTSACSLITGHSVGFPEKAKKKKNNNNEKTKTKTKLVIKCHRSLFFS